MSIDNRTCFQVNLRDGLRCRSCGRGPTRRETYHSGFGYHHITPRSAGGPDTIDNLVLLCRACHERHHGSGVAGEAGGSALHFERQPAPPSTPCHACGAAFDPQHVEMNCGWYGCDACATRVHLFDHFGFAEGI